MTKHPTTLKSRLASIQFPGFLLAMFLCSSVLAAGNAQQSEDAVKTGEDTTPELTDEVIFLDGSDVPWRFYVGSMANWMVPVEGPLTRSYKSNTVTVRIIDYLGRDDGYQAEWGGGLGQVYWQEFNAHDYRELAAAGGALSMVLRVDEKPNKKVELKMDCGYPCGGAVNVSNIFKAVPQEQWFRMSIKVSCFGEAGADLSNILSPLVVATTGTLKLSFAEVKLLTDPPVESVIPCG